MMSHCTTAAGIGESRGYIYPLCPRSYKRYNRAMDSVELQTERMAAGGAALARHEGRVIFIPYALPGERVRVRLRTGRKGWSAAELIEVLESSAERVEPLCPHFGQGKCGGCHWQHASYDAQLRYKTDIVREQLERIGKIDNPPVLPCIGMEEPWRYRNHVQMRNTPEGLGFVREDNRGIHPIDVCFIMNDAIYPLFKAVDGRQHPEIERLVLRGSERTGERLVILEGDAPAGLPSALPEGVPIVHRERKGRLRPLGGATSYHEQVGGRLWRIGANSFFQVNTLQAETLLRVAEDMIGPLEGTETLLDAYAGSGLFGLSLADRVGHTYLVESHPAAVADARHHAAGRQDVTIIEALAENILPRWRDPGPRPDLVLLDPPRAGCKEVVLQRLGEMAAPTIIYVSCDPATQARDIRYLVDRGYRLDGVQPVDMFPQTHHIEAVAKLRR
jgi:23S rRNA (uracil1939-C5)-methyltransferase